VEVVGGCTTASLLGDGKKKCLKCLAIVCVHTHTHTYIHIYIYIYIYIYLSIIKIFRFSAFILHMKVSVGTFILYGESLLQS
jgi:hypothetical protein